MAVPGVTGTPLAEQGRTGHLFSAPPGVTGKDAAEQPVERLLAACGLFSAPGNVHRTKSVCALP
eukprot:316147-Amphidinium_carterae.1